jgi:hypothetical protein
MIVVLSLISSSTLFSSLPPLFKNLFIMTSSDWKYLAARRKLGSLGSVWCEKSFFSLGSYIILLSGTFSGFISSGLDKG